MRSYKSPICFAVFITVLLASTDTPASQESPNDILVIVNNSLPERNIRIEALRSVFMGKRSTWKSGLKISPINAPLGSRLRNDFRKAVLRMTEIQETRYWQEQNVKYGTRKMATLSSSLKAVFMLKGAISYIFRSDYRKNTAKILLVIPENQKGDR